MSFPLFFPIDLKRKAEPYIQASLLFSGSLFRASSYSSGRLRSSAFIRPFALSRSALVVYLGGIFGRSVVLSSTSPIVLTPLYYIPRYPQLFYLFAPNPSILPIRGQYYRLSSRTSALFFGQRINTTSNCSVLYELYMLAQVVYQLQRQLGTCLMFKEKLYIQGLSTASSRTFLLAHFRIISQVNATQASLGLATALATIVAILASQIVRRSMYPIPPLSLGRQAQKLQSSVFRRTSQIKRQYSFSSRFRIDRGIGIKRAAYRGSDIIRVFLIRTLPLSKRQNLLYILRIVSNFVTIASQNCLVYSLLSTLTGILRCSYQHLFSSEMIQIPQIVIFGTLPTLRRQDFSRLIFAPIAFAQISSISIVASASA